MLNINNLPTTIRAWIVVREVDGKLWFWGSWNDRETAQDAARQVGGMVIARDLVEA